MISNGQLDYLGYIKRAKIFKSLINYSPVRVNTLELLSIVSNYERGLKKNIVS